MQPANDRTVLGDFDDASFTAHGVTSTLFRREERFFVRTDGPAGRLKEYPIAYTFGADPLQQYLIEFPGGRYQVLSLGWDTRSASDGGQRWFHLYPDEEIRHDDVLHWTGPYQTWNHMCAECHSTDLKKNYLPQEGRYETTWFEMNVACEACHGPGSRHVDMAETAREADFRDGNTGNGLVVSLGEAEAVRWTFHEGGATARRVPPRISQAELDTCARCHSRRSLIHDRYRHGQPLMDTHQPALLDDGLYYPDGQILDEVYVYGSFRQSRMYQAGVGCSDCHNPHSLELTSAGNGVCRVCHRAETFDTPEHHYHSPGSAGAQCVECHMPARNYMVVDPRRDHSFRIPRPDLSVKLGTPNACNTCHTDRSFEWATEAVARWFGPDRADETHFGEAVQAGRDGIPGAERALAEVAADASAPAIVRASSLSLLRRFPQPDVLPVIRDSLRDGDPLVRTSALSALGALEPPARLPLAAPLLSDPIRAVRIEAARVLAAVPASLWHPARLPARDRALDEYRQAQRINADRAESHVNLGILDQDLHDLEQAERAYRSALEIAPLPVAAINLSDLYRLQGRDEEGEGVLRRALEAAPQDAGLHHALGLLLTRERRHTEALDHFGQAAEREPGWARYAYVFAVALQSAGRLDRSLEVLEAAHRRHPADQDILVGLALYNRERGALDAAARYAERLVELAPNDPRFRRLLAELQASRRW